MSNPPMPPLFGQIIETFWANIKLITLFTVLSIIIWIFCGHTMNEMVANLQFAIDNPDTTETDLPYSPSIIMFLISFCVNIYIYYQLSIVAITYHQQPPHQPRTAPWITDKGFHQHLWRYMWHHFLIALLYIACFIGLSFITIIGAATQIELLILIGTLLFFIVLIALAPLTTTKLAAVIDPNGDASFKAAFRRGKDIFWKYLGAVILTFISMFIAFIILGIFISLLATFIGSNIINDQGQIMMADNMNLIGYIVLFAFMFIGGIVGSFFNIALSVISSHYYIWSEYYLPNEQKS